MQQLNTASEVIEALGGLKAVRALFDAKQSTVGMWKQAGAFPANRYLAMLSMLRARGYNAPASLWRQK